MDNFLSIVREAIARLGDYDAVPSKVTITRKQLDALRYYAQQNGLVPVVDERFADYRLFGVKIEVED